MRIHSLIHESFEDAGYIPVWAKEHGHPFSETRLFSGEKLPSSDEYDLLVVMGGAMNIYEEEKYPWLSGEKKFIKSAIDSGKKVIGICLGAQLIASVLGAEVKKNAVPEIGWFPVETTPNGEKTVFCRDIPGRFVPLHWHGDTFDIPHGAVHLFTSAGCRNQGFLFGEKVVGLQFHPEPTPDLLKNLIENSQDAFKVNSEFIEPAESIPDPSHIAPANEVMSVILAYFDAIDN